MPKKQPLYPHMPKSRKKKETPLKTHPTRDDVSVVVWEERDRLHIGIQDKDSGDSYMDWWDDDARQMFEDGFFKGGIIRRQLDQVPSRELEESVLGYAEEMGILSRGSSEVKADYYYCDNTRLHPNNEVLQIKTTEENPKCPYCGAVMTYGRYWGPLLATESR